LVLDSFWKHTYMSRKQSDPSVTPKGANMRSVAGI